ncbi:DUF4202 domain-containing protein [Psychromonas aquatilis]|uniref:DUF4202 domain-containing protein n=1 Tax=Psychromonas aquatilis TaxID=2005072 RepID=A0ABU9GQH4_9GAMM
MTQGKLKQAIELIDLANHQDPNKETVDNVEWAKEHLYSVRMSEMLARFKTNADQVLQIACRGQHMLRWQSARSDYPLGKQGYHQWRTELYTFHANHVAKIMEEVGYDQNAIDRAKTAVSKKSIKRNADSQLLEDVAGLVFIEHYMLAFAQKHPEYSEEKWMAIILKTWKKMSEAAHEFVLAGKITLPAPLQNLIIKSISE